MSVQSNSLSQVNGRPRFTTETVAAFLAEQYGIRGTLAALPSERDQNFRVSVAGTHRFVAKVANAAEDADVLDLQHDAMTHLAAAGIGCPRPVESRPGPTVLRLDGHLFRVLTFLPGELLAVRGVRSAELLKDLGVFLARVTEGFTGFDHPAAGRHLQWDVSHGVDVLSHYLPEVTADRRPLVERALGAFEEHVAPTLDALPHSVIHNDANDHNVLVAGQRVTGLIDFGDMVRSVTLNELAVGCAYAGFGQPDPWHVMEVVAEGYQTRRQLSDLDRALLPHLVRTRLATSVAISAHQQALAPHDAYLSISEAPAWRALAAFDQRLENT